MSKFILSLKTIFIYYKIVTAILANYKASVNLFVKNPIKYFFWKHLFYLGQTINKIFWSILKQTIQKYAAFIIILNFYLHIVGKQDTIKKKILIYRNIIRKDKIL